MCPGREAWPAFWGEKTPFWAISWCWEGNWWFWGTQQRAISPFQRFHLWPALASSAGAAGMPGSAMPWGITGGQEQGVPATL